VSSKSSPWARVALASTALAALTRARLPISELSAGPPRRSATPRTARPKSSEAAAGALPRVSRASSVAVATTGPGTLARSRPATKDARRLAAVTSALVAVEHFLDRGRRHLDLYAGTLLLQEHRHPRVPVAPTA